MTTFCVVFLFAGGVFPAGEILAWLMVSGLLGFALGDSLYFAALQRCGVQTVDLLAHRRVASLGLGGLGLGRGDGLLRRGATDGLVVTASLVDLSFEIGELLLLVGDALVEAAALRALAGEQLLEVLAVVLELGKLRLGLGLTLARRLLGCLCPCVHFLLPCFEFY